MDSITDFDDFDDLMHDINKAYDDLDYEYQAYFKTRQIVPYKSVDFTLVIYLNCISTYFNYMSLYFIKKHFLKNT
jgi:hypothetical protein